MAKTLKTATKIVFGNKEKKQFPDPEGLEREKPSSAIEGSTQPLGFETRLRNKFSEAAPPMPGAKQTLNNRLQRVGSVRRSVTLAAPRKEEVDGNMENKTFTQFVTEAKRGRPRKLRPGEKADTEHLQDQLSKLTHPNHVIVHFADGTKHQIPRGHANKALQKLASLKPEHRAAHVEHMHSSHENFYKTLAGHPIPSKKKTITLAGPKLRKEEVEQIDELSEPTLKSYMSKARKDKKKHDDESTYHYGKYGHAHHDGDKEKAAMHWKAGAESVKKSLKREDGLRLAKKKRAALKATNEEAELDEAKDSDKPERTEHSWPTRRNKQGGWHWANSLSGGHASAEAADRHYVNSMKKMSNTKVHIDDIKPGDRPLSKPVGLGGRSRGLPKWAKSSVKEEAEQDDGWYAHKEMHGKDAVSREDWKKGIRKKPTVKKEEVESDEKKKKDHHKLLQKFRHRIDEIKAIKGTHATKLHAAKVIHPDKVGYAGKQTKPKVQNLRREDYAPLETGEKQDHVDQKTVDAKSRKQGAEKPKKPKMEMTKEAWALYDTLSDKNKAIFEKMDAAERDALVDKYISGKR